MKKIQLCFVLGFLLVMSFSNSFAENGCVMLHTSVSDHSQRMLDRALEELVLNFQYAKLIASRAKSSLEKDAEKAMMCNCESASSYLKSAASRARKASSARDQSGLMGELMHAREDCDMALEEIQNCTAIDATDKIFLR